MNRALHGWGGARLHPHKHGAEAPTRMKSGV